MTEQNLAIFGAAIMGLFAVGFVLHGIRLIYWAVTYSYYKHILTEIKAVHNQIAEMNQHSSVSVSSVKTLLYALHERQIPSYRKILGNELPCDLEVPICPRCCKSILPQDHVINYGDEQVCSELCKYKFVCSEGEL